MLNRDLLNNGLLNDNAFHNRGSEFSARRQHHKIRIGARFDLAVDRHEGVLEVIGERWEAGWNGRRRPIRPTTQALGELASFLGVGVRRER